ncbi:hypothetical protein, partial [Aeromonas caviae]|uniref:hypothetical protein n=1 Tax=Aeromonas caviae TaxID=648 RepID=UPI00227FF2AC
MERVISVKANYLVEHFDYKVTIITLNSSLKSFFTLSDNIEVVTFSYRNRKEIIKFVNNTKPDVFISTGGKEISLLPFFSKKILKIVEIHFCFQYPILREISAGSNFFMKVFGFFKLLRHIFYLNFAHVVVSLTSSDDEKWRLLLPFSKAKKISNPVPVINCLQFSNESFKIGCARNRFVAIGRLDHQKGYFDLLNTC